MGKLIIPEVIYQRAKQHLIRDENEHVAFFFADSWESTSGPIFIVRDIHIVPDERLAGPTRHGIDLRTEDLLAVVNMAVQRRAALVEAHSHPGSDYPSFSAFDQQGFTEFVPYVLDSLPRPYAATVWGEEGVYGLCWNQQPGTKGLKISIVGEKVRWVSWAPKQVELRDDRHARMFGGHVTSQIGHLKIGIVGLSGIGSHIAQQLACLRPQDVVCVDRERVETVNLNRMVCTFPQDVGKPKTEVIGKMVKRVSRKTNVLGLQADLRTPAVLDALKGADVIFGCLDNDGARLILNELAIAYQIPFIDCGAEADAPGGRLESAGGRINIVLPGGPCLHCMGQIDTNEARENLALPEEIEQARKLGYIRGDDEPSPAVISLNGLVASSAITEFLVLLSGVRPVARFLTYDLLGSGRGGDAQWLVPQRVSSQPGCVACGYNGLGDEVELQRYVPNRIMIPYEV